MTERQALERMTKGALIELIIYLEREVHYLSTGEYPEDADHNVGGKGQNQTQEEPHD